MIKELAEAFGLSESTIKKIVKKTRLEDGVDEAKFNAEIEKAQQNKARRKRQTIKAEKFYFLNSFIINQLMQYNISKWQIAEFDVTNDANRSHVIRSVDNYEEELKINAGDDESIIFNGLTVNDLINLSAIFTMFEKDLVSNKKRVKDDIWFDVDIYNLYAVVNPGKRLDRTSKRQYIEFAQGVLSLQKINRLTGSYYRKGLPHTITNERGTMLIHITPENKILHIQISRNGLIAQCKEQRRIIAIDSKLLQYGSNIGNNNLIKYIIAERVSINSEKMQKAISLAKLDKICGKANRAFIKGYMQYLQDENIIDEYTVTRKHITWSKSKKSKSPLIIIRDDNGEISKNPPAKTEAVKQREKDLKAINNYLAKQDVRLNGKRIDTALHAVYCDNDWNKGGRLYTSKNGYQSLKKEERANLTINGENVIELDFSAYHPNLLYAYENKQLNEDPYNFWHDRKAAKKALNIVLNAKDRTAAIGAVKHAVDPGTNVYLLLQAMETAHSSISKYFYSGAGTGLQNIDGEIAVKILLELKKQHVPALPIHDSFIVRQRDASALRGVMDSAYRQYTGNFYCGVK